MTIANSTITIYATPWCGDCKRALRVFNQHQIDVYYVNIEEDDEARQYVEQVNNGYQSVPTIVFPDGSVMVEPSSAALAQKLAALNR